MPDPVAILAIVVLLLPQAYFLFASPSFLFVSLAIPGVTVLLRVLFSLHFKLLIGAGGLSALAFLVTGRPAMACVPAAVALAALLARPRFLAAFDEAIARRDLGEVAAVGRLRRLHVAGMAANGMVLIGLLVAFPRILPVS